MEQRGAGEGHTKKNHHPQKNTKQMTYNSRHSKLHSSFVRVNATGSTIRDVITMRFKQNH